MNEMMKKGKIVFGLIFGFMLLTLMSNFVSAYHYYGGYLGSGIDAMVRAWEPIFGAIFGGVGWSGMYLFERILFFLILMIVVYLALGRMPLFEDVGGNSRKSIRWVVAIIIPLLGIRWINYEWMTAMIMQYTLFAIVLTCAIPFLLYFFFIYNVGEDYGALRKILWLLFIGIYAGLYSTVGAQESTIYLWTTIVSIACLFLDGTIAKRYRWMQMLKEDKTLKNSQIIAHNKKIRELEEALDQGTTLDPKTTKRQIAELRKHVKWLIRQ